LAAIAVAAIAVAGVDVAVIGAGPAGAVAACLLARAGCAVLLLDPRIAGATSPKPGDALPGAALRVLQACDLPLPSQNPAHRPIRGNISAWGTPDAVYRDFLNEPDGPAWRLDRVVFEDELIGAARDAGAVVNPSVFRSVTREDGLWRLDLHNAGYVTARWVVDATGRRAAVARRLGAIRHRDEALVAVVGYAKPNSRYVVERSLVETAPLGWWYAALLPDRRPVFMLHTRPAAAARLRAAPQTWCAALATTRHIAAAFPDPVLDGPLRGYEACGAALHPIHGDGWIACGDAALSFDPCAAQGLFSALYSGMAIGRALPSALHGDLGALCEYAAGCAEIRRVYRQRVRAYYADECRWPEAEFWRTAASTAGR